jgi:serine protease AprX
VIKAGNKPTSGAMPLKVVKIDREVRPKPGEVVSFEVLCRPRTGADLSAMMGELSFDALDRSFPEERTVAEVTRTLLQLGFRVYSDDSSTSISAEGPHELFARVFQTALRKRARTLQAGVREHRFQFFDTAKDAPEPSIAEVPGALYVAIQRPPIFFQSPLPPPVGYFHLRVPGDVAMLTNASATHRQKTPSGDRATGAGIKVGMLDTGFFVHPYIQAHGYRLTPICAADAAPPPEKDSHGHGSGEVANIFACAPDAEVFGVKMGANPVLSFDRAVSLGARVISCSWGYHLPGVATLPAALVPLRLRILAAISSGITVVFSAGNGQVGFPGMMPEVISVGGVYADNAGALRASDYASSFLSLIYPGRRVPDLCGLVGMQPQAVYIFLPLPKGCVIDRDLGGSPYPEKDETGTRDGWGLFSGTSAAAPQVAGICALLLQKKPTLTPERVKAVLRLTAVDVKKGASAMGEPAGPGADAATGAGLVHALKAWTAV